MHRQRPQNLFTLVLLTNLLAFGGIAHTYESPIQTTITEAQSGLIDAQLELAIAYEHGEGIGRDPQQAVKWYCLAALKGSVDAQRNLAWMFLNGRGVAKNEAVAVHWFTSAAKQGDKFSRHILSYLDTRLKSKQTVCDASALPMWETSQCKRQCKSIVKQASDIARRYHIEPTLVLAIIQQESRFNIKARSHKGAIGLMQLMPQTARRFGVKNILNPKENITGGVRYLSWLLKEYRGDVALTLAGYNAGEQAVAHYKGIPPYKETQNYVQRILKIYGKKYHPYQQALSMNQASSPSYSAKPYNTLTVQR